MNNILDSDKIDFFRENGYLVIPEFLTIDQVKYLRTKILDIFYSDKWKTSHYNTERVLSDVYNTYPDFIELTLNVKVIEIVRQLLGSTPVLMPETAIHYKFYTNWHKDTTSQEKIGKTFHWNDDALMLQCGFYLQDNDELGGGLTVMPKSHKTKDNFKTQDFLSPRFIDRLKLKFGIYKEENDKKLNPNNHKIIDVKSKAGDFVIFDFRLNHRATKPLKLSVEFVPEDKSKIAFFNAFSPDNYVVKEYLDFIENRKEPFYQSLKTRKLSSELLNTATSLNFKAL